MKARPLFSLGVLCDDGLTSTLDKQAVKVQKNTQKLLTGHRKNTQECGKFLSQKIKKEQTTVIEHNITPQATIPELARYYHAALFIPT